MQVVRPSRSALIVAVPEAESAVGDWRLRLDPSARLGVPAHVTVLFPFVPAADVDAAVLRRLAGLFAAEPAFDHRLVHIDRFGAEVLWVASDAADRFRRLTALVYSAFPDHPPYEGRFDEVVPHLTVADRPSAEDMAAAERTVRARLPIAATVHSVRLLVEDTAGHWRPAAEFPLHTQQG